MSKNNSKKVWLLNLIIGIAIIITIIAGFIYFDNYIARSTTLNTTFNNEIVNVALFTTAVLTCLVAILALLLAFNFFIERKKIEDIKQQYETVISQFQKMKLDATLNDKHFNHILDSIYNLFQTSASNPTLLKKLLPLFYEQMFIYQTLSNDMKNKRSALDYLSAKGTKQSLERLKEIIIGDDEDKEIKEKAIIIRDSILKNAIK